ncbi:C2 domain-containing protein [Lactarius psammicola]|nr:C2 domain-containing protein [Lactarius psammicola]
MVPSNTALKSSRTAQPYIVTRTLGRGSRGDSSSSSETPVVILRVQVLSCQNLQAKDRNGYSDPFVIVSILGKQCHTPVCKRNLNPVYEPKDATFDFPIYASLVHKLGALKFVVWDKDVIKNDYLGEYTLPVHQWFQGTAFAFSDNQPRSVDLVSSLPTSTVHGTMRIKVGFVHPPHSTSLPNFGKTYNALINHGGIVLLEICGAIDLPEWHNMTYTGWDMDPFVQVSIGEEVKCTSVIRHSRNPVWNEQLLFHVRDHDLSLPIQLTVIDWDRLTSNDPVGKAEINIATLVEEAKKRDLSAEFYHVDFPTLTKFNLTLTKNPKRAYKCDPTIEFRASYQSYAVLRKPVRSRTAREPTAAAVPQHRQLLVNT